MHYQEKYRLSQTKGDSLIEGSAKPSKHWIRFSDFPRPTA